MHTTLPDFRNLGVIARVIVIAESIRFLFTLLASPDFRFTFSGFAVNATLFEPALLLCVALLYFLSSLIARLPYRIGIASVLGLAIASGLLPWIMVSTYLYFPLYLHEGIRVALVSVLVASTLLFYFDWRQRTLSPALSEARLTALQSRIRPHFLFNSLNTVLGLIRPDPRRAESVLENLADLFRALMADTRTLVPLAQELALTRAYLEVEGFRLGDRLRVAWHCDQAPMEASVPQLILQPLAENAVIHGIEPIPTGGEIQINIFAKEQRLLMVVRNTCPSDSAKSTVKRPGNHMALANIRERLDLHFDAEARMTHFTTGGEFVVQIEIPLRHAAG